ncbi:hypothetical protein OROHE_026078 [Orobanche hederae]
MADHHLQSKICSACGDEGIEDVLVCCSSCRKMHHLYCNERRGIMNMCDGCQIKEEASLSPGHDDSRSYSIAINSTDQWADAVEASRTPYTGGPIKKEGGSSKKEDTAGKASSSRPYGPPQKKRFLNLKDICSRGPSK